MAALTSARMHHLHLGRFKKGWSTATGDPCERVRAYGLSVEQTPPSPETADPEATRLARSLDQLSRVMTAHALRFLRYVLMDGAYSKRHFLRGVRALGLHPIGK